jgi:hypothetical protein
LVVKNGSNNLSLISSGDAQAVVANADLYPFMTRIARIAADAAEGDAMPSV